MVILDVINFLADGVAVILRAVNTKRAEILLTKLSEKQPDVFFVKR